MANRLFNQFANTLESGVVKLFGTMTIGASGAITASSCKGFSVVKTAATTGRYTITLNDKYNSLKAIDIRSQGPADAALTSTSGIIASIRNVAVSSTIPILQVQFSSNTNLADADPTSGIVVYFEITLKNSSLTF